MPVNRYELPAQQQVANTYVNLPYQELLLAGQSMQKQSDDLEAKRLEFADKKLYGLSPDEQVIKDGYNWLQTETDKIADLYGKDGMRQANQAFATFSKEAKKRLGQYGDLGTAMSNYDAYQAHLKKEEERMKKGDITPEQLETWKVDAIKKYSKQGGIGTDPNNWQGIGLENLANYKSYTDFFDKKGENIKADISKLGTVSYGQDGQVIVKKHNSNEIVSPQEVEKILRPYFEGDDEMKYYFEQGKRMGYTKEESMLNALYGAVNKYSYKKTESTTDWDVNSNWGRMLDEKEKTASIISRPEIPEPMDNPELTKNVWGILGKDSELAQNYAKQQTEFKAKVDMTDAQIREAYKIANNPNATPEARRDAAANYQSLNMQKTMMFAEQDTKNQVYNAVVNNVFKANGIKSSDMKTFNTMSTLVNNVDKTNSEIKKLTTELNSIGNAAFNVLDEDGKTIPADDYRNTLRQQIKNLENSNINAYKELYTITTGEEANVNSIQDLTKLKVNPYNVAKKSLKESSEAIATYETDRVKQTTSTFIGGVPNNGHYKQINSFLQTNPDLFKVEILDDATGKYKEAPKYSDPFGWDKTDEIKTVTRQNAETNSYTMTVTDSKGNFIREERYTPKADVPDLDKTLINFYKSVDPTGVNPSSTNAIMKLESKEVLNSTNASIKHLAGVKPSEFRNVYAPPTMLPNDYYSVINVDGVVNGKKHYNIEVYNPQGQKVKLGLDDNTPLEGLTDEQLKNANMLIYQKLANPNQSN